MAKRKKNKTAKKRGGNSTSNFSNNQLAKLLIQDLQELKKAQAAAKRKKTIAQQEKLAREFYTDLISVSRKPRKKAKAKPPAPPTKNTGFKVNDYNRIRKLIWQNHKADFKGGYFDKELLRVTAEIFNDCRAFNVVCDDVTILEKYKQLVLTERREEPIIGAKLLNPMPYWEIKETPFTTFAPYLWIISPMIIAPPSEFLVTHYYNREGDWADGYYKFFKEWVDWCNDTLRSQFGDMVKSEDVDIYFKFLPVTYNADKKRWEAEIVICTIKGHIFDFGFKPVKGHQHKPADEFKPATPELLTQEPTTQQKEQQNLQLAQKHKETNLTNALNQFLQTLKDQAKKQREQELRERLKKTEQLSQEMKGLTKIRKELEKLYEAAQKAGNKKSMREIKKELAVLSSNFLKLSQKYRNHLLS